MSGKESGGSVGRVRAALTAAGHPDTIVQFPAGTRTAAEAAAAVGCGIAQIAKSIVFRCGARPVIVITSGANRVDPAKVKAALCHCEEAAGRRSNLGQTSLHLHEIASLRSQ